MMTTSAPINRSSFEEHFKVTEPSTHNQEMSSDLKAESWSVEQTKDYQRRDSKWAVDVVNNEDSKLEPSEQVADADTVFIHQLDTTVTLDPASSSNSVNKIAVLAEAELPGKGQTVASSIGSSEALLAVEEVDNSSQVSINTFATADGGLSDNDELDTSAAEVIDETSGQIFVEGHSVENNNAAGNVVEDLQPISDAESSAESAIHMKDAITVDGVDQISNEECFMKKADIVENVAEEPQLISTSDLEIEKSVSDPPELPDRPDDVNNQINPIPVEDNELKREENSAVGMFRRFTSTFSLRNARGTFGSRESLRNGVTPPNLGNRDSGKSSLSDDSNTSEQTVTTPNGIYSRDIPDSFSMLDDTSSIRSAATVDLLVARIEAQSKVSDPKPVVTHLRSGSISRLKGLVDEEAEANIDWEFWGNLISDYPGMVRKQSRLVSKNIQNGIPPSLRGPIWQLISKSKDPPLEILYHQLLEQTSSFDKMIKRDLSRTFPKHEFFQNDGVGQESLYNVVKGFSLYDTDVGYCQGIPFIVGPLLLHMPEEEAFCVLVRLMRAYGLRGHFTPQMETLHLRLYQFDHLLEEYLPTLHKHMLAESITSSMYASQWFMTLFAYRFPLPLVFRIFDIIFAEGVESLLRFAIALLKANQDKLLEMPFETLLDYLKHHLYEVYDGKINQLISDAYDIKITTKRLDRLSRDYYTEVKKQQAETNLIESLKGNNKRLEEEVKRLESNVQTLNEEHCELANEFVQSKLDIARLQDENESLKFEVAQLREQLEQSRKEAEHSVKQEMELLAHKNFELADRNTRLEDHLSELEAQLIETKMRYAESENERVQLQKKWDDLRRAFH